MPDTSRIKHTFLASKVMSASQAAALIRDGMVVGASGFTRSGSSIVPTTSVGNSAIFVQQARQVIVEINEAVATGIRGIHDVYLPEDPTGRAILPITEVWQRIGQDVINCDPGKIVSIVFTNQKDSPPRLPPIMPLPQPLPGIYCIFLKTK